MSFILKTKKGKISFVLVVLALVALLGSLLSTSGTSFSSVLPGAIILLAVAFVLAWGQIKYVRTPAQQLWSQWDRCQNDEPQRIRMARAINGQLTVLTIDEKSKCAYFVGGKGEKYLTTLASCTCPDFKERKVPCKHMYRLASELKMPNLPVPLEINNY